MNIITGQQICLVATLSISGMTHLGSKENGLSQLRAVKITQDLNQNARFVRLNIICIKTDIPQEICDINDELKAIYHSKDTVCIWIFKTRDDRNKFMDETAGMLKGQEKNISNLSINNKTKVLIIANTKPR